MSQRNKTSSPLREEVSGREASTKTKTSEDRDASELALDHQRDWEISKRDAAAAAPADTSVCGEEDPGASLEYLVRSEPDEKPKDGPR